MFRRTASRRTAPSRSSSSATVTEHRRRPGRAQVSWSPVEAAAAAAAPGVAVGADLTCGGVLTAVTISAEDRRAEELAVAARLDRAWRRLDEARCATEGRPGRIGDDAARRDPVTQPFPIAFGTPARAARPATPPTGVPAGARPQGPAPHAGTPHASAPHASAPHAGTPHASIPIGPRPVRSGHAAMSLHRPHAAGQVHRARPPRRLTVDRWSTTVG